MGLYEHDDNGIWQLREELDFGTEPDDDGGRTAPQAPAEPPAPTDLARLKLRSHPETGRLGQGPPLRRRTGSRALMAMVQWLLARLNAFRPMRAFQHYNLQHGPLMSAGIGFRMFFSITGLLATGFSVAGLLLQRAARPAGPDHQERRHQRARAS